MEVRELVSIAFGAASAGCLLSLLFLTSYLPTAGRNFGPAGVGSLAVRAVGAFGVFDPPHCAISVNHTEITCVTAPGVGKVIFVGSTEVCVCGGGGGG